MREAKQIRNRKRIQIEAKEAAITYDFDRILSPVRADHTRLCLRREHT